jgi:beta-N-acetylhexosaminidase
VGLPLAALRGQDERPFARLVASGVRLVMVGTATYPALDRRPAALSRRVVTGELRGRLGFRGVVVSDALDTPALVGAGGPGQVAAAAAAAGVDLLLFSSYASAARAADGLSEAIRAGRLDRDRAARAAGRVLALRRSLPGPAR